ncbi:hypothetical protein [Streptomyces sp. TLI_55]|uniref:hypothetical protein n=1 Tax=Streptomyces sp. TLI_55 TaxID=1938861 RepID=UPI00359C3DF4
MEHRVVGYDVNPGRVRQLAAGQSYVEDVGSARLRAVLESGAQGTRGFSQDRFRLDPGRARVVASPTSGRPSALRKAARPKNVRSKSPPLR